MPTKLEILQQQRNDLISEIKKGLSLKIRKEKEQELLQIQKDMANLNKLDEDEKNINAVWIGIPPKGEFDNLKAWAKYNQDYKIHIWTDYTHILAHILGSLIAKNSKKITNSVEEHDYQREADLKDEFYNEYQLKNREKTFDENAKQFLVDKGFATESQILGWIQAGKTRIIEEQQEIQKYTSNQVTVHDVNKEGKELFPSEAYHEGYLKTLEHLHIAAGASDRLRYAIVDKFGGGYWDTDLALTFDLESIKNNEKITELINLIEWDTTNNSFNRLEKKFEIIINEIILLDNLTELNDEKIKDFAKRWEELFKGSFEKNFNIFKEIAKEFKNMNLTLKPTTQLSNFPINNAFQTIFYERENHNIYNAFILAKKDSKLLQAAMKKIEETDEKISDMDTYKKLVNKNLMILFHTGPCLLYYTLMEFDQDYFYQHNINRASLLTLDRITGFESTWWTDNQPKDAIKDIDEIRYLFLDHTKDFKVLSYNKRPEIKKILEKQKDSTLTKEEKQQAWQDSSLWFISKQLEQLEQEIMEEEKNLALLDAETENYALFESEAAASTKNSLFTTLIEERDNEQFLLEEIEQTM